MERNSRSFALPLLLGFLMMVVHQNSSSGPLSHGLELTVKADRKVALIAARKARLTAAGSLLVGAGLSQHEASPVAPEIMRAKDAGATTFSTRVCVEGGIKFAVTANVKLCGNHEVPVRGPTLKIASV